MNLQHLLSMYHCHQNHTSFIIMDMYFKIKVLYVYLYVEQDSFYMYTSCL